MIMTEPVDLSDYIDNSGDGKSPESSFEPANPAWREFVGEAPKEVYEKYIEPAYSKWDQHVNKRFQEYSQYEPWKDVVKSADPETAGFALNLLRALNENPGEVVKGLREYYKIEDAATGQGQNEPKVEQEDPYAQRFAQIEEHNKIMAAALLQQREEEANKKAESWLDSELGRLREENKGRGDFDEKYVCALASSGNVSLDDAVQAYYEMADRIAGQNRYKPLVMGNGGGAPGGQKFNPRSMSNKDANSLVVDILNATNAQRQQ